MCRLNSTRTYYKASTQTPIKHKNIKNVQNNSKQTKQNNVAIQFMFKII